MRFLVDAMLGSLARWLRLFGFDTLYANDLIAPGQDGLPDAALAIVARDEDRILITRDKEFAQRVAGSIFISGTEIIEILQEVQHALDIQLTFNQDLARCTACNHPLLKIPDKTTIEGRVPSKTYSRFNEFWMCTNVDCMKIFWQGSHFEDIRAVEAELKKS